MNSRATSSGRSTAVNPAPDGDDLPPTETTSIVSAQSQRDYQSTQRPPSTRSRRQPAAPQLPAHNEQVDDENDDGSDGPEKQHWLREYFDSIWTIELENKGSVARDHLALGRFHATQALEARMAGWWGWPCHCVPLTWCQPLSRTNLLGLVADVAGFRLDRHCHHAAVSP